MKQKVTYFSLAFVLALLMSMNLHAQRQITNRITDRIYKADVQPKRERLPNIINTLLHDEYSPAISPDGKFIVFQSNKGGKSWEYYRLWEAKRDSVTGFWTEPKPIESINSKAGEGDFIGGPFVSYDGKHLYFFAKLGGGNEDIYVSERTAGGEWGEPVAIGGQVNTGEYEGFPSVSSDNQRLYFVRKGEEGKTTCYKLMVSKKQLDGTWGAAEELPSPVNMGCEKHVRIMPDNESIFFSSTRTGGSPKKSQDFDLYHSRMQAGGSWSEPVVVDVAPLVKSTMYSYQPDMLVSVAPHDDPHVTAYFSAYMGASHELFSIPLSSGMAPKRTCDFKGMVIDSVTGKPLQATIKVDNDTRTSLSYQMKNQADGKFHTVITEGNKYKFTVELEGYRTYVAYSDLTDGFDIGDCEKLIKMQRSGVQATVSVLDGLTRELIAEANADIKADDASKGKVSDFAKKGDGTFTAILEPGTTYTANATAEQYNPGSVLLDLTNKQAGDTISREILLYDLSKIAFDNINFNTARPRNTTPRELEASLLPKAKEELDKVAKFLQDYPMMSISIEGHTDYRGSDAFNQGLSERRVAAAKYYLVNKKGISESRLTTKGFGESSPIVPNEVNGRANQANMALNRRVEFKVIQK